MTRALAASLALLGLLGALIGVLWFARLAPAPDDLGRRAAWVRLTGLADAALGAGWPVLRHRALADPASLWAPEPSLREAWPAWPLGPPPEAWRGQAGFVRHP
jgi:hypothetical protein